MEVLSQFGVVLDLFHHHIQNRTAELKIGLKQTYKCFAVVRV